MDGAQFAECFQIFAELNRMEIQILDCQRQRIAGLRQNFCAASTVD